MATEDPFFTDTPPFGEVPLHLVHLADGTYQVAPEDGASADACAVDQLFPAERLEIMRARALAFGYRLNIAEGA